MPIVPPVKMPPPKPATTAKNVAVAERRRPLTAVGTGDGEDDTGAQHHGGTGCDGERMIAYPTRDPVEPTRVGEQRRENQCEQEVYCTAHEAVKCRYI